ncbi:lysosomal alpha-glucosidase [Lampris incognitus]|uniref:lysosomal alpha-glucosidase n=1 Tax=Lampris incognitus TaxID=2546036 RepID=UPI0024B62365|nr:lysosomal alpha-glucosidase [Lampris incognitus]
MGTLSAACAPVLLLLPPALAINVLLLTCLFAGRWSDPKVGLLKSAHAPHNQTTVNAKRADGRDASCTAAPESRFDCARDKAVSREECEGRGCCYAPLPDFAFGGPPWCFYPRSYSGYGMGPLTPSQRGLAAVLMRPDPSYLPKDIPTLRLEVMKETAGRLHLTVKDPSSRRYEVPLPSGRPGGSVKTQDTLYAIEFNTDPFGFIVRRKSNGRVIVNTTVAPLLFADQYLQLSTSLSSSLVSGLGEHYTPLSLDLNWTSLTLWNRDMAPHANSNLYGSHPFCVVQEEDGLAHGVFLLNSNAMEIALQPTPALTWVAVGGILDLYIFLGPDPQSVVRQYLQVIGYPMMPPYWSLGFHLCRWGYSSTNATREVAQRMHNANFPLDVQWNDLDYADNRRVFTYDPRRFGDLPDMVEEFHQRGMKYVLILDPGIGSSSPPGTYPPFDDGQKRGVFIKNASGQTLIGKVWPGPTAFPDFTHPETRNWWEDCIREFHSKVPLDGLWIDMNEPASFVQGSVEGCPDSELENPPYTPKVVGGQLNSGTLCMSAQQEISTHYNLHNLYGLMEASATHSALTKVRGKRPFVLSRSSFPAIGRFSGVWTGDVRSDWEQLRYSVPAVLQFGLFGVPLVGADICGFGGNTTEELCVRWMQLGAFYPFMRNHNDQPNAPQEPFVFGQQAQAAMRHALNLRYSLLPFLYTLFHHAHTSADTVARPLFLEDVSCSPLISNFFCALLSFLAVSTLYFQNSATCRGIATLYCQHMIMSPVDSQSQCAYFSTPPCLSVPLRFPTDPNCQTIDRQFLWGSSLLVSPVLEQGKEELAVYLPPGTWYSLHNGQPFYSKGQYLLLPAPLDTINVHVREGHVVPQQETALTTTASRRNPFFLTVALSAGGWARGDLFWDDGDSLGTFETGDYSYVLFIAGQSQLVSDPVKLNGALDGLVVGGLRVFGVPSPPHYVWANGEKIRDFTYRSDTKALTVTSLALAMSEVFTVQWAL